MAFASTTTFTSATSTTDSTSSTATTSTFATVTIVIGSYALPEGLCWAHQVTDWPELS